MSSTGDAQRGRPAALVLRLRHGLAAVARRRAGRRRQERTKWRRRLLLSSCGASFVPCWWRLSTAAFVGAPRFVAPAAGLSARRQWPPAGGLPRHQGTGAGAMGRDSVFRICSVALLAIFGWSGDQKPAEAEEAEQLKDLLMDDRRRRALSRRGTNRRDDMMKKVTDWFEWFAVAKAEERRQHTNDSDFYWLQTSPIFGGHTKNGDSWFPTVFHASEDGEKQESNGRRQRPEVTAGRSSSDGDVRQHGSARRRESSRIDSRGSKPPEEPEEDGDSGGFMSFVSSVKTAVTAAMFGSRRGLDSIDSSKDAGSVDEVEQSPQIGLPNPEEFFKSAQDAAMRFQGEMLGSSPLPYEGVAPEASVNVSRYRSTSRQPPANPSANAASSAAEAAASAASMAASLAAGNALPAPAQEEDRRPATSAQNSSSSAATPAGLVEKVEPATERVEPADATDTAQPPAVDDASLPPDKLIVDDLPLPEAPGMEDANLVVKADIEPVSSAAVELGRQGMQRFMAQPGGAILAAMAQDGWDVSVLDSSKGLYQVSLPSVRYELPGGTVSIPSPVFVATVYDSFKRTGGFEERLKGDLVLQNGKDILTVELGFPFRTTFSISTAAWTRCTIGWEDGEVSVSNLVEVGVQTPSVPGLRQLLQYFVKTYGIESTSEVSQALARAADVPLPAEQPTQEDQQEQAPKPAPLSDADGVTPRTDAASPAQQPAKLVDEKSSKDIDVAPVPNVADKGERESVAVDAPGTNEADMPPAAEQPPPEVPGMEAANLVVNVDIDPRASKVAEEKEPEVQRFMAQPGGAILKAMAQEGWEVNPIDESAGVFEVLLPSVKYEAAGGSMVSIPAPRFRACVRDTFRRSGEYEERLSGDLVLQNGEDIITVELGFPFRSSFSISAAGWTRCRIGWERGTISVSNSIELGLKVPGVPGLTSVLQYFVKSYGVESTVQVAEALVRGAEMLPPASPAEKLSLALGEASSSAAKALGEASSSASKVVGEASSNMVEAARKGMAELPLVGAGEQAPVEPEVEAALAPSPSSSSSSSALSSPPPVPAAVEGQREGDALDLRAMSSPVVPGMERANLTVRVDIDGKISQAIQTGSDGVSRLMDQSGGIILSTMARDGWVVKSVNSDKGLYEVSLPSVDCSLPGGVVSIPSPRFSTTVRDLFRRVDGGDLTERLVGDLVLVNGEDIISVRLGFPFNTKLSLSAAGFCRCLVAWEADRIVVSTYIEVGLQLPGVPGLEQLMRYFVRTYGAESTAQVAASLAGGADSLPLQPEALAKWLQQQWRSLLEATTESVGLALTGAAAAEQAEQGSQPVTIEAEVTKPRGKGDKK